MDKVYDYVIAYSSLKGKKSDMKVIEDFESRPHKAVTFVAERGKAGTARAKNAKGAARTQWRKATRRRRGRRMRKERTGAEEK